MEVKYALDKRNFKIISGEYREETVGYVREFYLGKTQIYGVPIFDTMEQLYEHYNTLLASEKHRGELIITEAASNMVKLTKLCFGNDSVL